jgi:hypothetical protein
MTKEEKLERSLYRMTRLALSYRRRARAAEHIVDRLPDSSVVRAIHQDLVAEQKRIAQIKKTLEQTVLVGMRGLDILEPKS